MQKQVAFLGHDPVVVSIHAKYAEDWVKLLLIARRQPPCFHNMQRFLDLALCLSLLSLGLVNVAFFHGGVPAMSGSIFTNH